MRHTLDKQLMDEETINEPRGNKSPPESRSGVRLRGLCLLLAGAALTPIFFFMAYFLGLLLAFLFGDNGPVKIAVGLIALPLVLSFIGVIELLTGFSFRHLNQLSEKGIFEQGFVEGLALVGAFVLVIASAVGFVVMFVYLYNFAVQGGWL